MTHTFRHDKVGKAFMVVSIDGLTMSFAFPYGGDVTETEALARAERAILHLADDRVLANKAELSKLMDIDRSMILKAADFAKNQHGMIGHKRKYTGEPYHVHLEEVAGLIQAAGLRREVVMAAWLHDVLEDTPTTAKEVEYRFGPDVARLVLEVTDVSRPKDGNRAVRKAKDRAHLARASAEGKSIKLADLVSNTRSIVAHDPNFSVVYLREKRALLPFLTEGDAGLFALATELAQ